RFVFLVGTWERAAAPWGHRAPGPFYRFDDFQFAEMVKPAGSASPRLSILLGYSGDTMIELISVDEDPTGIFDVPQTPCPHHVAVLVDDIADYLQRRGGAAPVLLQGRFPTGTPIAMLDTRRELGLLTELVTVDESVRGMIEQMRAEAAEFNGDGLLRGFE
ncbi:MAG: VOC family protein, partial [Pseudohaliea sp.]